MVFESTSWNGLPNKNELGNWIFVRLGISASKNNLEKATFQCHSTWIIETASLRNDGRQNRQIYTFLDLSLVAYFA